jgi:uncharacterized phage protein (TIGR01671 family)
MIELRDIRFRAWDKRNNKWFHPDLLIITNAGFYTDYRAFEDGCSLFDYEYELMQYTGLKDKNGKDIYEGDVVKGYWWEKGVSHRHIGKVAYGMSAFKVVGIKQYLGISDELSPVYEVIGNLCENPDLLKE